MAGTFVALDGFTPLRAAPTDRSEQVSQLLFGELFSIEEQQPKWLRVTGLHDGYTGWIAANQAYTPFEQAQRWTVNVKELPMQVATQAHLYLQPIGLGSYVYGVQQGETVVWELTDRTYHIPIAGLQTSPTTWWAAVQQVHDLLMGVPYLWGGRTAWGLDCSGLVQLAGRLAGLQLPRDASQQVRLGQEISVGAHKQGDLAFFHSPTGAVTHVGFVNDPISTILHASGSVRVDYLTKAGISHRQTGLLTHHLYAIRRLQP